MSWTISRTLNGSIVCAPQHKRQWKPLTSVQLSIRTLQFIKSIDNDADNVNQMALFNVLKEDGEAKKLDLDSLYKIQPHRIQLQEHKYLFDEALM